MSWQDLKKFLANDPDYLANREVARRVVNNYHAVVDYFLGTMSKGTIESLGRMMGREMSAEYYQFISHPFDEKLKNPFGTALICTMQEIVI